MSSFMQISMKIMLFPPFSTQNFNDFLFAIKLSYDLLQGWNIKKICEIKLKFFVLYISPARPGTVLSVVREMTCIKKN